MGGTWLKTWLGVFVFSFAVAAHADNTPEFSVDREVPIEPLLDGQFALVVDAGNLPCGASGQLKIKLVNENAIRFPVQSLEASCSCTHGKLSKHVIDEFSSATLVAQLETPLVSQSIEKSVRFSIISSDSKARNISLLVRYKLDGLMCFKDTINVFPYRPQGKLKRYVLPFVLTKPNLPEDVIFDLKPETDGVQFELKGGQGEHYVELALVPELLSGKPRSYSLTASNLLTDLKHSTAITLMPKEKLRISPNIIQFHSKGDVWTGATAIAS
ncbi:MAG: hypothetical protein AAGD07_08465 [Planctomycetota bacterium]